MLSRSKGRFPWGLENLNESWQPKSVVAASVALWVAVSRAFPQDSMVSLKESSVLDQVSSADILILSKYD